LHFKASSDRLPYTADMRPRIAILLLGTGLSAQDVVPHGTTPKTAASDYSVHVRLPDAEIGADYLVRSVLVGGKSFLTDDYLVVEVAVYPLQRRELLLSTSRFSLRINGRKQEILSQAPAMVSAS